MNKEIKIKTLGELLDFVETEEKAKELIDYISNLQEESKKLNEIIETLKETNKLLINQKYKLEYELDILDNKRDNAIEYIKWHYDLGTKENVEFCLLRDRLLEILESKGE